MSSGKELLVREALECESVEKVVSSFDTNKDELEDYIEITFQKKIRDLAAYEKMATCLRLTPDELFMSLPKPTIGSCLNKRAELLEAALETLENRDYLVTYLTIKRFLRELSRPMVNKTTLEKLIKKQN